MSILRRRTFVRKADDTRQDVSDAAASGNVSSPNQPWTRKADDAAAAGLWEPTEEALKSASQTVQTGIKAPFVRCQTSSLGGIARSAVLIAISLDPKETWQNGIFENSRSGRISISREGVVEHFSGQFSTGGFSNRYNFRKYRAKTLDAAITKINAFLAAAPQTTKAARPGLRKDGNFLPNRSRVPDQTTIDRGRTPQFPNGAKPGDKITTRLSGSFSATYTLRSKTNPFDGGTEFYYQWSAMGEQSRSDDEYPTMRELNQALANTYRIQMQESKEESDAGKAARPAMRKASDPRIEWFKRNPDKLKGRFVNAGGLVGFVVGTGKVGNTNMVGLKIKDSHGDIDVADLSSLKSVDRDDAADRKAGVPSAKAARPAMRKAGGASDDNLIQWLVSEGWDRDTAAMEVANYRKYGIKELDPTPRKAITQALQELRGTTKAAVIDPAIKIVGTPFDARARILNKTNGRLLKSKEFRGRFAKASARAWADAEVKKLL